MKNMFILEKIKKIIYKKYKPNCFSKDCKFY